jgi:1,4-dihydroxy-2-naphthoyl-CoA synthase
LAHETIIWEKAGALGRLTLNRPDSLNAWTPQLGLELRTIIERDAADESVTRLLQHATKAGGPRGPHHARTWEREQCRNNPSAGSSPSR